KVYAKVELEQAGSGGLSIPSNTNVSDVKILTPTVSAVLISNDLEEKGNTVFPISNIPPAKEHGRVAERKSKRWAPIKRAWESNAGPPRARRIPGILPKPMRRVARLFFRHFNKLSEQILCAIRGESGLSPPKIEQILCAIRGESGLSPPKIGRMGA